MYLNKNNDFISSNPWTRPAGIVVCGKLRDTPVLQFEIKSYDVKFPCLPVLYVCLLNEIILL